MTKRSQQNLSVGMHGEAFDSAKYKRFAAFARTRDHGKLADLFMQAADESRIGCFAEEMQVAGLISDDVSNADDMIQDKLYHAERYRQFAQEAEQDGDSSVAELFRRLVTDNDNAVRELQLAILPYRKIS